MVVRRLVWGGVVFCLAAACAAFAGDERAAAKVAAAAPPAAADPFAARRDLKLDAAGRALAPQKVRFSRLELEIEDGQLFPVRAAAGEIVGFQFLGHGVFRHTVRDQEALLTFRANAERVSKGYAFGDDHVRDKFTSATVLFARPAFEDLWRDGVAPEVAAPPRAAADLAETLKLLDRMHMPLFDHLAGQALLNDVAGQQYVYAEFDGGEAGRTGYEFDGVNGGREGIFGFANTGDGRFTKAISSEPLDRPLPWRIEHADIALDTPDNQTGTIATTLRLRTTAPGVRAPSFELMNHRDPAARSWRATKRLLNVRRVVDGRGRELPFSHRYDEIVVDLGERLPAGAEFSLRFETEGEVLAAANGEHGDNYLDLFLVRWFPQAAAATEQRGFTFSMSLRTKKPFVPVASGDTVSLAEDGDHWLLKTASDVPTWLPAVFAGKYLTAEVKGERWTVRAHAYSWGNKEDRERVARLGAQFLEIYEKMLGPYPNKELDIVELPTMDYFGVSPDGLIVLTSRFFAPREFQLHQDVALAVHEWNSSYDEYFSNRGLNAVIAHEIAHQWFGHKAWPARAEDAWLDESCAEYAAGLAVGVATRGAAPKRGHVKDFKGMLEDWRGWNDMVKDDMAIAAAGGSNDDNAFRYRTYLLYSRGPLVLHMLRTLIGDERFLAVMRQYLADAQVGPRTTDDFSASAGKVLGTDMHWFFDQWIRRPGTPTVKVEKSIDETGAAPVLRVKLSQPRGAAFKKIHVPFVLTFPDGRREVRLAFQETPTQEFAFPLAAKPTLIEVDPARNNLAKFE
ncbi:MAG: M1 family aminopeptidase [Candidatus Polarisedimenticolia bacterium]